jgi:hypothetical protein
MIKVAEAIRREAATGTATSGTKDGLVIVVSKVQYSPHWIHDELTTYVALNYQLDNLKLSTSESALVVSLVPGKGRCSVPDKLHMIQELPETRVS